MFLRCSHLSKASRRVASATCAASCDKGVGKECRSVRLVQSSSSSSGGFGDYFASLRWKAASALTSTMPENEQRQLLEKLGKGSSDLGLTQGIDDNDKEEDVSQPTIEEKIALAKANEAKLFEEKWNREKEALIAEAEEAARRRVQNDLEIQKRQIAFEAWKKNLEKEKEESNQQEDVESQTSSSSIALKQLETEALGEHPILGPAVADLGHKRIHVVSSRALAAIPIWKRQRIYRHDRAKSMASDKMKSLHLGLPGIIGIYESTDGSLKIIDGQHRIGMLQVLKEKSASDSFDFDKILVEVYPQNGDEEEHAKDLFLEVNKAEPVKLVDLPGVAKASDRKVINQGADRLKERFPDMFSASQRCRPPHLNIDNLRDALFASNVIQKHSINTAKALEQWMLNQNEMLQAEFQSEEKRKLVSAKALAKADKFGFYLGLDSSWFYH